MLFGAAWKQSFRLWWLAIRFTITCQYFILNVYVLLREQVVRLFLHVLYQEAAVYYCTLLPVGRIVVAEADQDEHACSSRWHRSLQHHSSCSCTRVARHQDGTWYAFRSLALLLTFFFIFCLCPFICVFAWLQDHSKSYEWNLIGQKFYMRWDITWKELIIFRCRNF